MIEPENSIVSEDLTSEPKLCNIFELKCMVQSYEWGKLGFESKVASLFKVANPDYEIDEDTPYAELWMGTHPNAPSECKSTGELLSSIISEFPECLGEPIRQEFNDELPFLFKVLSINKALSIQAHPSKAHAEELFVEQPEIYRDPNHKPELAIALTKFEALCGFRPIKEIQNYMKNVREIRSIVGNDVAEKFIIADEPEAKEILKVCFRNMMTCPQDNVINQFSQLLFKFSRLDETERTVQLASLVERLYEQFPDDIGCFAVYFLNYVELEPLQALFLGPNEPHAYLSGDCVECMACSDNVVRAGLTPKYKDVETLCSMLTYESHTAESVVFKPRAEDKYVDIFVPPVSDFAVAKIIIPSGESFYRLPTRNSASIFLIVAGSGKWNLETLRIGTVFFVPANERIEITDVTQDILIFQAMANVDKDFGRLKLRSL